MAHRHLILGAVVAVGVVLGTGPTNAQTASPSGSATQAAYDTAMRCFVANGSARGDRRNAGDAAGAVRYDEKSRQSFDMAVRLGRTLNYSNERINGDLGSAMERELPRMVGNETYFRQVVATCRAYGLM